jgi:hypothetical protein
MQYYSFKQGFVAGSSTTVERAENPDKGRLKPSNQIQETRSNISDEEGLSAAYYNALARGHWGIENHLHWHLDVTFREDSCRARKDSAPENLPTLRKLALQMVREQPDKLRLKKRRLKAEYDLAYLEKLIT